MAVKNTGGAGESKLWAFLAIFLGIIGFILVLLVKKNDQYAMYYAKQSLVLFITGVCISVVGWIPILGWLIALIGFPIMLILWIVGLIYSLSGETKPIPLIGQYGEQFKF